MAKKLLTLHYRPPLKNGRSNSFGQYYFHKEFWRKFEVRGIAFGDQHENLDDFKIIPLQSSSYKKLAKLIFGMKSVRLTHFESSQFRKGFYKEVEDFNPDIIYVEHILMMQYLVDFKTKAKIILFDDDSFLYSKANGLEGSFFQKVRNFGLAKYEKKALDRADYIITITEQEKSYLESLGYRVVHWIPYGIDTEYFSFNWKQPKENSILFIGNFDHYPNREAVKFLTREVLPVLPKLNCKLRIVGRNINRIRKYITEEIEVFEDVEDIRKFYWNSSLFIAPIFSGAGLRIKMLESFACGIPVISTHLSQLGLNIRENLFTAIKPEDYIEKIKLLLDQNEEFTLEYRKRARKIVERDFTTNRFKQRIRECCEQIKIS